RRHTRFSRDWSSDVCSSDLLLVLALPLYYFWQSMNPVGQPPLEQKTLGSLTATPVPLDDLGPYLHDGIYVKDFRVDFCEGCISRSEERRVGRGGRARGGGWQ